MRPSQKHTLLDAALRLVGSAAGAEITLDAVAREAGMTKAGLLYHFPSRRHLMLAVVEHTALLWETEMLAALGMPFESATPHRRIAAYAQVAGSRRRNRADFAIFTDATYRPMLTGGWTERLARWFALPVELPAADRTRLTLVRLAADGLWMADATGVFAPDQPDRSALLELMTDLLAERLPA